MRKGQKIISCWMPLEISGQEFEDFANWLNAWGDFDKHDRCLDNKYVTKKGKPNHITEFGEGYNQAISDIFDKLKIKSVRMTINKTSDVRKKENE